MGPAQAIRHDRRDQRPRREADGRALRRITVGGALGMLPGLLLAVVPLLLHDVGLISSDQSQIGFIGVPLLIVGAFVGIATAAADCGCVGTALLGAGAGFLVGLALGLTIVAGLSALGAHVGVLWLFLTPIGMIGGATLAAHLQLRERHRHDTT